MFVKRDYMGYVYSFQTYETFVCLYNTNKYICNFLSEFFESLDNRYFQAS